MSLKRVVSFLILGGLAVATVVGIYLLFALRFERGDNYAPYSTLRSDPLGTRVLYESLSLLPRVRVERNMEPLGDFKKGAGTALFVMGIDQSDLFELCAEKDLDQFIMDGGRLVVTLVPMNSRVVFGKLSDEDFKTTHTTTSTRPSVKTRDEATSPSEKRREARRRFIERKLKPWREERETTSTADVENDEFHPFSFSAAIADFRTSFAQLQLGPDEKWIPEPAKNVTEMNLPVEAPWYSSVYFSHTEKHWKTILARDGRPVVIERRFGKGSVVLASDSYFVANEALRDDPQPLLLSWLAGPNYAIVFDETHLGTFDVPGVMGLARRYHLMSIAAVLLIIALLTIWMEMFGLAPQVDGAESARHELEREEGRDARGGMVDLLERNIDPATLPRLCVEEWLRSVPPNRPGMERMKERLWRIVVAEENLPARERNPVRAYRDIAAILESERRRGFAAPAEAKIEKPAEPKSA